MRRSLGLISLATNMLEGWDIIHLIGTIHSSVWTTKTFLYDIREPRYKPIKIGSQISKLSDIGPSNFLNSNVPYCFTYISAIYRNGFELEACLRMSPLKSDMSRPSKIFIAREIMDKSWRYRIQRNEYDFYLKFLKSDNPYWFAYILAP